MSKRVRVPVPGVRINETACRVLWAIAKRAEDQMGLRCAPIAVSYKQLRACVPVSEQTVMRACASLRENGLVDIIHATAENGGQNANIYQVTALGLEVLRLTEGCIG